MYLLADAFTVISIATDVCMKIPRGNVSIEDSSSISQDEFEGIKTGKFITWGPLPIVDKDSLMAHFDSLDLNPWPSNSLQREKLIANDKEEVKFYQEHEHNKSKGKRRRAIEKELRKSMSQTTTEQRRVENAIMEAKTIKRGVEMYHGIASAKFYSKP